MFCRNYFIKQMILKIKNDFRTNARVSASKSKVPKTLIKDDSKGEFNEQNILHKKKLKIESYVCKLLFKIVSFV